MKKTIFITALLICVAAATRPQSLSVFMTNFTASGAPITSGGWDSLTSGSVTNAATIDINLSTWYAQYSNIVIMISVKPVTDNVDLHMLVSADGSTYNTGGSDYTWNFNYGSGSTGNTSAFMNLMGNCGSASGKHNDGWLVMQNLSSATQFPMVRYNIAETDAAGGIAPINGAAYRGNNQITKAIRLIYSTGNITGTYKVLGSY